MAYICSVNKLTVELGYEKTINPWCWYSGNNNGK